MGGGRRYLGRDDYAIYLAGGEEISQQEMEQVILERNEPRELMRMGIIRPRVEVLNN